MPNNPMLNYKPGMTLDAPVPITMAAADWLCMMTWFAQIDQPGMLDGVKHLVYGIITPQVAEAVHTAASRKHMESLIAEHLEMNIRERNIKDALSEHVADVLSQMHEESKENDDNEQD